MATEMKAKSKAIPWWILADQKIHVSHQSSSTDLNPYINIGKYCDFIIQLEILNNKISCTILSNIFICVSMDLYALHLKITSLKSWSFAEQEEFRWKQKQKTIRRVFTFTLLYKCWNIADAFIWFNKLTFELKHLDRSTISIFYIDISHCPNKFKMNNFRSACLASVYI